MDVCLCFLSPLWLALSLCNWKTSSAVLSWDFYPPPPFIMQLQNRKTNSGNRPPNVINFVGAWGWRGAGVGGGGGGWGGGTIIAGGRILISCRFLPVWLAWPWPITSELCVTVSLPVLPKEWTEAGAVEHRQDGGRRRREGERRYRERERGRERQNKTHEDETAGK